ncbi:hypothetical protein D3C77_601980 [compost metagenome]
MVSLFLPNTETAIMLRMLVLLLALIGAAPALAHHGWSSYDAEQPLTLETEIVEVHYRNPHAELVIEHAGRQWRVILAPVSRLRARGLAESDLQVGQRVTLVGYPRKDGSAELRAERITVEDRTVELR